jgi:CheY-like chemotaxis protein
MARILVVDDEPSIRALIRTVLEHEGHTITTAENGRLAVESVIESVPDLIVLDLMMPEMDGWHFLEELHNRGLRGQTRVVIVSGHFDATSATERSAVRHVLPKPFDPQALVDLIDDALAVEAADLYEQRDRRVQLARLMDRMDDVLH